MEVDKNKKSSDNIRFFKGINLKKRQMFDPNALNSSNSNANINYYKNKNIIPLSRLFKYKLNNIGQNNNMEESKFNSVEKIPIYPHLRKNANSLNNYNSVSFNKISSIKLPKIRKNNNDNNEKVNHDKKDSVIISILNKFDDYDNKFKEQEKISNLIIQRGDRYLKLKKDYIDENDKYKYCASKHNYKKQYSNLFKRIKNIHLI